MNNEPYWFNVLIAFDQLLNTLLGGDHDTCLSTRAYVQAQLDGPNKQRWQRVEKMINTCFFDETHCKDSYLWELSKNKRWVQQYQGL